MKSERNTSNLQMNRTGSKMNSLKQQIEFDKLRSKMQSNNSGKHVDLLKSLKSTDDLTRNQAAIRFGEIPKEEFPINEITNIINSKHLGARYSGIFALRGIVQSENLEPRFFPPKILKILIRRISDRNPERIFDAEDVLTMLASHNPMLFEKKDYYQQVIDSLDSPRSSMKMRKAMLKIVYQIAEHPYSKMNSELVMAVVKRINDSSSQVRKLARETIKTALLNTKTDEILKKKITAKI